MNITEKALKHIKILLLCVNIYYVEWRTKYTLSGQIWKICFKCTNILSGSFLKKKNSIEWKWMDYIVNKRMFTHTLVICTYSVHIHNKKHIKKKFQRFLLVWTLFFFVRSLFQNICIILKVGFVLKCNCMFVENMKIILCFGVGNGNSFIQKLFSFCKDTENMG